MLDERNNGLDNAEVNIIPWCLKSKWSINNAGVIVNTKKKITDKKLKRFEIHFFILRIGNCIL